MKADRIVWEISKWEFLRWFKWKDQFIALVVTCTLGLLIWGGKALYDRSEREPVTVYVVNGQLLEFAVPEGSRLILQSVPADSEQILRRAVGRREVDAVLSMKSVDEADLAVYKPPAWGGELQEVLSQARMQSRIRSLNLSQEEVADAFRPFSLHIVFDEEADRPAGIAEKIAAGLIIGIMLMGLLVSFAYQFVTITGEKQLRVTEQIISAVSPQQWIDGKILGLSALALASTGTYIVSSLIFVGISGAFGDMLAVPAEVTSPVTIIVLVFLGLTGYLFWNTFFAALAATINDPNTSAKSSMIFVPLVLTSGPAVFALRDPESTISQILSIVPGASPAALAVRLVLTDVPAWHVVAAFVLMAAAIWLMRTAAGKIFHLGILMYGKEPTMKELWRWMREV